MHWNGINCEPEAWLRFFENCIRLRSDYLSMQVLKTRMDFGKSHLRFSIGWLWIQSDWKALILHRHAWASELIHFQYDSFRKALFLNSYASALELIQFQYSSCRKESIPDSHASRPLTSSFLNAILKEKHCFWTVTPRPQNSFIFDSIWLETYWFWTVTPQALNYFNINTILTEKYWFWTVTPLSLWIEYFSIDFSKKSNHASGSELITFQCKTWRKESILDRHVSGSALMDFNRIRKALILDSHAWRSELIHFRWNVWCSN